MGCGRRGRGRHPRILIGIDVTRGRILRTALIVLAVGLAVAVGGFLWWAQPQPLLPEANAALANSEAIHGTPAPVESGPRGQMVRGAELAMGEVGDTTGVLIWPGRMVWVGPETITSLIEAHGTNPGTILRPAWHGDPGWPILLPTEHLDALRAVAPDRMPPAVVDDLVAAVPSRVIEMGDPGVAFDADTPAAELQAYEGPPDPPAGHTHEWGADVAAEAGLEPR